MASEQCDHPAASQHTLFTARDYISHDHFAVQVCGRCSLVRTYPRPDGHAKDRYYPSAYYGDDRRYVLPVDSALNYLQARRSKRIHRMNGERPGTVLDIGCGRGLLLNQLRKLGWTVVGTELSAGAARFARESLNLDVRVGELENLEFEEGSFDAVVLWHVLEHLDDPARMFQLITTLLRAGGFVVVAVPNFGSMEARCFKAHWFHLDVPRHVSHFTVETLTHMLETEGYSVERVRYFSPEYDFFSVVQSALDMIGIEQHSLYELLRTGAAKLFRRRDAAVRRRDVAANLLLAPVLAALALLWVPLAASFRQGATMTLFARKA